MSLEVSMEIIAKITDCDILGTEGLSEAKPRVAARAILSNQDGLYAVMYASKFNLYSLPGGGVEENEEIVEAIKREILEETGFQCSIVSELGIVYENRFHSDFTQYSYYYIAKTIGEVQETDLDVGEIIDGTRVEWYPLTEVVRLITTQILETNQQKFIQAKDRVALQTYLSKEEKR